MKYLMAFMFAAIPAVIAGGLLWFVVGPFALLFGWAIFGLGIEVCLNGTEE